MGKPRFLRIDFLRTILFVVHYFVFLCTILLYVHYFVFYALFCFLTEPFINFIYDFRLFKFNNEQQL